MTLQLRVAAGVAGRAAGVARVLRPGARLVTVTHDWVLRDVDGLVDTLASAFADVTRCAVRVDEGRATRLVVTAR